MYYVSNVLNFICLKYIIPLSGFFIFIRTFFFVFLRDK